MRTQTHRHTHTQTDTQTERGYNHKNGVIKEHNPDISQSSVISFECIQPSLYLNNKYSYSKYMHTLCHHQFSKHFTHELYFFVINRSCYFCVFNIIAGQKSKYSNFLGGMKGVKPYLFYKLLRSGPIEKESAEFPNGQVKISF